MRSILPIFLFALISSLPSRAQTRSIIDFYDRQIAFTSNPVRLNFDGKLSPENFFAFIRKMDEVDYNSVINALSDYKKNAKPDDWLYYQLIRKTAQYFSPKADDYIRYTLYKWYFLTRTGYHAILSISPGKILFYVQSDELIYNLPYREKSGKQYICLNYHDYGSIDFGTEKFEEVFLPAPGAANAFSYKVTRLPEFSDQTFKYKDILFNYNGTDYHFRIKVNDEIKVIFKNYPAVEYASQFNVPVNSKTYNSLIPLLRKQIKGLKPQSGVEFLMNFSRYAFVYKPDVEVFGQEKRLSPEQTLLSEYSDCEDRAALFFFLVKEIYDLPMIVLASPKHVTIAVQFDKAIGHTIDYNGRKYSICEPTPQRMPLAVGQLTPEIAKQSFEIVYAYQPGR